MRVYFVLCNYVLFSERSLIFNQKTKHGLRFGAEGTRRIRPIPENQLLSGMFAGDFLCRPQYGLYFYQRSTNLQVSMKNNT